MSEMKHAGTDNTNTRNLFQRLNAVAAEVGYVSKNLQVDAGKGKSYKATSEVDILAAVKPLLYKHGIYCYPEKRDIIEQSEYTNQYGTLQRYAKMKTWYTFINIDNPSEKITVESYGEALDSGDKGLGKAMTYSDKYAVMKAFMIQTGEDPDAVASPEDKKTVPAENSRAFTELANKAKEERDALGELYEQLGQDIDSANTKNYIIAKAKVLSADPETVAKTGDAEALERMVKVFKALQNAAKRKIGEKMITDQTETF